MKTHVVHISNKGGRVYTNPEPKDLPTDGVLIYNPGMALVIGVPPQFWTADRGIIRPMNAKETLARGLPLSPIAVDRPAFREDHKRLSKQLGRPSLTNIFHKLRYSLRNRKLLQCLLSFAVGALVSALLTGI